MAETLINEVTGFLLEWNRRLIEESNIEADMFSSWDDVASQDDIMFSPALFKKYFITFWEKLIEMIHSRNMVHNWHCCGNVNNVLPLMIDAGIDAFDVLQTSAKDMEIESFYRRFGKDICVTGGLDVQKLLIEASPREIAGEVKKIKDIWGNAGGLILGPSHEVVPETSIQNVLAIYDSYDQ
jgi:uroporphyrinogen decarboxylase